MTVAEFTNLLGAIAAVIAALTGAWSVIVSRRGVAVGTRNETALSDVKQKQITNKDDLQTEIQAVLVELHNGAGDSIAAKAAEHLKPVLAETAASIAVLAEKSQTWDGVERRVGPEDRRK